MAESMDLQSLIAKFSDAHVLCIGDLMLDRFVEGRVERISPEAPIPVLAVKNETALLGGAGNVARNLTALGAGCHLIAAVGRDDAAGEIDGLLQKCEGVTPDLLRIDTRPTSVKIRYMSGGQQLLRSDYEQTGNLAEDAVARLLDLANAAMKNCDLLVLSDYGKGVLGVETVSKLIDAATRNGLPVIVDPKGRNYRKYAGARLVTPNLQELALASGLPVGTDVDVVNACGAIMENCGVFAVLATRSEEGMSLVSGPSNAQKITHLGARTREVFDVSGAGDTVVAGLAAALAVGAELADAARFANTAAGVVVGKVGTAVVYPSEILSASHEDVWQQGVDKLVTRKAARDRVALWRRKGHVVGFTNGCFDLLHPGHISLINQARASCDKLILGLNSDQSVARLKGPERPVQNEASRATVLSSLSKVDMVVIFGEDTPLDLICELKPDVLIKGADYTLDAVVGAKEVKSWGGRVKLANLVMGQSTTRTIKKLT